MTRILIVEDEPIIRKSLRRLLERNHYEASEASTVKEALAIIEEQGADLIISDLRLPGEPGTDLIKLQPSIPVLIMTSYASLRSAVDAMKMGAVDYIAKPFDHDDILAAVANILGSRAARRPASQGELPGFIGNSAEMQKLYEQIKKFAPTTTTVLVQGETGTGKELVAQALHAASQRSHMPMVSVNCAAIPETLIESELFGYEKGAFTGAANNRIGLIEAAAGGTLFLDEIGELPLEAQARLLRFLQEGEIRAIGSVKTRKVDVRLIAATHRNLKKLSRSGDFREDLYYRINVMQFNLPPLRARGNDILTIAQALLEHCCAKLDKAPIRFSARARSALLAYRWPGNVRELQNVVERAAILCESDTIDCDLLNIDIEPDAADSAVDSGQPDSQSSTLAAIDPGEELSLEDYFQRFVLEHQDTMSETELARKLGVSRKCLWERRQRLGIPRKKCSKGSARRSAGGV